MLIPHAFKLFDDLYALKGHANKDVRVPAAAAFLAFVQQVSPPTLPYGGASPIISATTSSHGRTAPHADAMRSVR